MFKTTPFLRQLWVTSGVLCSVLGLGMEMGFPSALLPELRKTKEFPLDNEAASWIVSSTMIATLPAVLIFSTIMERYGRRAAHMAIQVPGVIGWLIIYSSSSVTMLIIGKIIGGMTITNAFFGSLLIGEYASPCHRGLFIIFKSTFICSGVIIVHVLGRFFQWRTVAGLSIIPFVFSLFNTFTWKESPDWLIKNNRFREAEDNFYWFRDKTNKTVTEMKNIKRAQEKKRAAEEDSGKEKIKNFLKIFKRKDMFKPMSLHLAGSIAIEFSGRPIFPAIALDLVKKMIELDISDAFYYIMVIDAINIASAIVSCSIVKIFRRRVIIFSTGLTSIVLLIMLSVYLYLLKLNVIPKDYNWIPMLMLVVYFVLVNSGFAPILMAISGELYPLHHRRAAVLFYGVKSTILYGLTMKISFWMMNHWGVYGIFTCYACVLAVAYLYLFICLPETKDRTLLEIEEFFNTGKFAEDQKNEKEDVPFVKVS